MAIIIAGSGVTKIGDEEEIEGITCSLSPCDFCGGTGKYQGMCCPMGCGGGT